MSIRILESLYFSPSFPTFSSISFLPLFHLPFPYTLYHILFSFLLFYIHFLFTFFIYLFHILFITSFSPSCSSSSVSSQSLPHTTVHYILFFLLYFICLLQILFLLHLASPPSLLEMEEDLPPSPLNYLWPVIISLICFNLLSLFITKLPKSSFSVGPPSLFFCWVFIFIIFSEVYCRYVIFFLCL